MVSILSRFYNRAYYKRTYPQARISSRASLAGACDIGPGVTLEGNAALRDAVLGANSAVDSNASVQKSRLGRNVRIGGGTQVSGSRIEDYVCLGGGCSVANSHIQSYTYVAQETLLEQVTLGRFCSIGPRVIFGYGVHPTHLISTSPVFYSRAEQCGISFADRDGLEEQIPIQIGHDVWIGAQVYLRDGIRIGHGAIVGAGAVVTKDVPAYAIVGGVPARVIRYRFDDKTISRLLALEWWNWDEAALKQAQPFFADGNIDALLARPAQSSVASSKAAHE